MKYGISIGGFGQINRGYKLLETLTKSKHVIDLEIFNSKLNFEMKKLAIIKILKNIGKAFLFKQII